LMQLLAVKDWSEGNSQKYYDLLVSVYNGANSQETYLFN